jgi:hypothetical protein
MRRVSLLLAVLVLLAGGAYAAYWFHIARGIKDAAPAWAAAQRVQGYDIEWQTLAVEGFPFAVRLRLAGVALHADRPFPYAARSAALTATASPFDFRTWRVRAPEGLALDAPTLVAGIDAASLEGSVALGGEATIIALAAHEISGRGLARGVAAAAFEATLTLPERASEGRRDTALGLTASLLQATLAPIPAPLSRRLDALSLAASVKGPWPSGGFLRALVAWRDAGGTVEIENAHAAWGGTVLDLDGTLALDAAMQPEGAMTARVTGADKAVDAAVEAGAIEPRYAGVAKSVLRAISAKDETGAGALHVPLTIQDQRLYIGPAAVAALPQIDWR